MSLSAPATLTVPDRIVRKLSSVRSRGISEAPLSVPSTLKAAETMYATGKSAKTSATMATT